MYLKLANISHHQLLVISQKIANITHLILAKLANVSHDKFLVIYKKLANITQ